VPVSLIDFYTGNGFKKLLILVNCYIFCFANISKHAVNKSSVIYCTSDSIFVRLMAYFYSRNQKVKIIMTFNSILIRQDPNKFVLSINKLVSKRYLLSCFFPSILGFYSDKIITNNPMVYCEFLKRLAQKEIELHSDDICSVPSPKIFSVGIFLSAWEYHGYKNIEVIQDAIVSSLALELLKRGLTYFIRPHPHQRSFKSYSRDKTYEEDLKSCTYVISIASSALFECISYGGIPRRLEISETALKLDPNFTNIPAFNLQEIC